MEATWATLRVFQLLPHDVITREFLRVAPVPGARLDPVSVVDKLVALSLLFGRIVTHRSLGDDRLKARGIIDVQLSGAFRKELRLALQACYPTPDDLRLLVQESLNEPLQNISRDADLPTMAFNLIQWAIARGRLTELVQAAAADRPNDTALQKIAEQFVFATGADEGEIERVVLEKVGFQNVAQWLSKFSSVRRRVCRIEPQPQAEGLEGYGTGFLVGPDVLLTNYHVRSYFTNPLRVVARFDYEVDDEGLALNPGRECRLAAEEWSLAESPVEGLDYVLLRLAEHVGDDQVGSGTRGFLQPMVGDLDAGDPLLILQHPEAEPLKLSIGSVVSARTAEDCILYTANTKGGSSGSPCMNMALDTVALHHFGAKISNRGVLWSGIEDDLRKTGKFDLIG
jgi:hypothetical protein